MAVTRLNSTTPALDVALSLLCREQGQPLVRPRGAGSRPRSGCWGHDWPGDGGPAVSSGTAGRQDAVRELIWSFSSSGDKVAPSWLQVRPQGRLEHGGWELGLRV